MEPARSILHEQFARPLRPSFPFSGRGLVCDTAPGAETGHHVHAHDYVVVPLTSGTLRLEEPTGAREVRLESGASYARPAGIRHNVINANAYEFRFIEIELI
jgi:quercetin dioxygenase-like cupin family protein